MLPRLRFYAELLLAVDAAIASARRQGKDVVTALLDRSDAARVRAFDDVDQPLGLLGVFLLRHPAVPIITEMDSYAFLRPMAQLFECRVGNGKLLYSTLGLQDLQQYPEGKALLRSIYKYLDLETFAPKQSIEWETLVSI